MQLNLLFWIIVTVPFLSSCNDDTDKWTDLLNYKDFNNWTSYVAIPSTQVKTEEEMVDSANHFLAPKGYISDNPNQSVFSFQKVESKTMLVISGELIGFLTTKESFENYHLKMKFKYGKKWLWLGERPRDGGIFYPLDTMNREFNIHDGDIGSFWSFGAVADIPCRKSNQLPKSVTDITPIIGSLIPSLKDSMYLYDPSGQIDSFGVFIPDKQICIANPISDKALGEWNELELICFGDTAIHIVNGKVVMVLYNSRFKINNYYVPINKGQISFQSEGGEMFVEYIKIKHIDRIPEGYQK